MDTKRCNKCGAEKSRTELHKDATTRDGLNSRCKVCVQAYTKQYNASHADQQRAYREANKERQRVYFRDYAARHPDRAKKHYAKHREVLCERNRAWRLSNPAKHVAKEQRRRARKRNNGGSYTAAEWQALCEQYGNRCLACGADGPLTVDHIVPLEQGGSNDITNLQPLCNRCNSRKGTKTIDYRPKE